MDSNFEAPKTPEVIAKIPEDLDECRLLLGYIDEQFYDWAFTATSKHPSLHNKRLADIIIKDCELYSQSGETFNGVVTYIGTTKEERRNQRDRSIRLKEIAKYINNPRFNYINEESGNIIEFLKVIKNTSDFNDTSSTFFQAVTFVMRALSVRNQLTNRLNFNTQDFDDIKQVFNTLVAQSR